MGTVGRQAQHGQLPSKRLLPVLPLGQQFVRLQLFPLEQQEVDEPGPRGRKWWALARRKALIQLSQVAQQDRDRPEIEDDFVEGEKEFVLGRGQLEQRCLKQGIALQVQGLLRPALRHPCDEGRLFGLWAAGEIDQPQVSRR